MFGSSFLPQMFTYLWHCFKICWEFLPLADFSHCAQHFWEARQTGREIFEPCTSGSETLGGRGQCWCSEPELNTQLQVVDFACTFSEFLQTTPDCSPHHKWAIHVFLMFNGNLFCSLLGVHVWGRHTHQLFIITIGFILDRMGQKGCRW